MACKVEHELIASIVAWVEAERPSGAPTQVTRKDSQQVTLGILAEHNVDPVKSPFLVFISDAPEKMHPSLLRFGIRLENQFAIDDFDEVTAGGWQSAVGEMLNNKETAITAINGRMESHGSPWRVRYISEGVGSSEVDGERSRGLVDRWIITLQKFQFRG